MVNALVFLLVLAAAAIVHFVRLWRRAEAERESLSQAEVAAETERKALEKRLDGEQQARRKQGEELAELRRRNDKAKRRAEKSPEVPLGTAARIRDIEEQLERVQATLRRVEGERDLATRRADAIAFERDQLAKRVEDAGAPDRAQAEASRAAQEKAEGVLAVLREQLAKQGEELALARQTEARMRKRMDNQEQLYASIRAELDVKKDRIRAQEEQIQRLQALKVAVLDD